MIRKLLIVFASGIVLGIVALALAWIAGGEELRASIRDGEGVNWNIGEEYDGPVSQRSFAYDGSRTLVLSVPAELRFTRGEETKMIVEGPKEAVEALDWTDGKLSLTESMKNLRHGLDITIVAPQIAGLELDAPGDVELADLDQPALSIVSRGAVELDGTGKVGKLYVRTEGAGDIDLADMRAGDATVRIDGVGDIDIAASGIVDASISGAGSISLHARPKTLKSTINGIGTVDHDY
ncbi:hypothetical protein GCM10011371_15020 [Novosphingobium marinum]|uniref:Putative auto-transporter adhesin head GIN domain-containing protein n=1 Tax=Novosphingobium marinum TaxID=1514948 RepID=A0A7Z0BT60_9SPHN|nr:DUF2807 domain-containing protein [Novosphingobium marinum]NYH95616.1 hypothetical protein [Novosphingobium marinum]GGC28468.1 hypothetical protein GCM10011371_15020 [Novosphingobium marinum]